MCSTQGRGVIFNTYSIENISSYIHKLMKQKCPESKHSIKSIGLFICKDCKIVGNFKKKKKSAKDTI